MSHFTLNTQIFHLFFVTAERLRKFTVHVCKEFNSTTLVWRDCEICAHLAEALAAGETRILHCPHLILGRYARVHLHGYGYLTLCEVQVVELQLSGELFNGMICIQSCFEGVLTHTHLLLKV